MTDRGGYKFVTHPDTHVAPFACFPPRTSAATVRGLMLADPRMEELKALLPQAMLPDWARLAWLRGWLREHCQWSRKRLAQALCVRWEWRNDRGQLKDFARSESNV